MKNQIILDFGDIIQELKNNKVKLCLVKDNSWFVIDTQDNLYQIESYWHGSYLDKFIREGITVKFSLVDASNIKDWEKEVWEILRVEDFIKRMY